MNKPVYVLLLCTMLMCGVPFGTLYAGEKWPGVDEAVVNRIAREHGRKERPSLLPTAEGDLQLFMFLMAGTVGGFIAGYYWRVLLEGRKKLSDEKPTR
ncbi:MAG: cobalt transporter [Geobacteraceae bacterium]|nr:cobalt transporter [Geobacteraceae bacterium]